MQSSVDKAVELWCRPIAMAAALLLALGGCGSSTSSQGVAAAGSASSSASVVLPAALSGTTTLADFCKALIEVQHTPNSDPKVLAETLDQLRALQRDAPAEVRQDLQIQIDGGEDLVRISGTLIPRNPGSLMREVSASSQRLNAWEAAHC